MPTRVAHFTRTHGTTLMLRALEATGRLGCTLLSVGGIAVALVAAVEQARGTDGWIHEAGVPLVHLTDNPPPLSPQVMFGLLVGVSGAISSAGVMGLVAIQLRSVMLLNVHIIWLALLLAAQLCVGAYVLSAKTPALHTFLGAQFTTMNRRVLILVVTAIGLGLQTLTLLNGCWLQSMYSRLDELALDQEEEELQRSARGLRRPLLPPALPSTRPRPRDAPAAPDDPDTAQWRSRLQSRYGIDTRQLPDDMGRTDTPPELGPAPTQHRPGGCAVQ